MRPFYALLLTLPLAACGIQLPFFGGDEPAPVSTAQFPGEDTPRPEARPGEDGADAPETGVLGTTLATLGDATVSGLWLETPLVEVATPGRVSTETGASTRVQLIPTGGIGGSGSRISLAAMQALGLPLTAIAELTVEAL